MEVIIEQELRNIYYDHTADYQSAENYTKKQRKMVSVNRRLVKEWLKTQNTYTRYKPAVRKHKFQIIFVKDLADQIQLDLVDMGKYKNKNRGYYWILTAVRIGDTFRVSKYKSIFSKGYEANFTEEIFKIVVQGVQRRS